MGQGLLNVLLNKPTPPINNFVDPSLQEVRPPTAIDLIMEAIMGAVGIVKSHPAGSALDRSQAAGELLTAGLPLGAVTGIKRFFHGSKAKFNKFRVPNYAPGEYKALEDNYMMPGMIHTSSDPEMAASVAADTFINPEPGAMGSFNHRPASNPAFTKPGGYLYEVKLNPKNVMVDTDQNSPDWDALDAINETVHGEALRKVGVDGLMLHSDNDALQVAVTDPDLIEIVRRIRLQPKHKDPGALAAELAKMRRSRRPK